MDSKTITVRFNLQLYNKVLHHELSNSALIRKSVIQFLTCEEPNNTIDIDSTTPSYIEHLEDEILFLRNQNSALLIVKQPLLTRVISKLKSG
ncbi:unnamed protein product [marine sediment metagenome]|uniref:Uncharacterized protein n=1 Tax=marine sediment metagenome TaxID=412755 RepID=X1AL26_9ZZZZ